MSKVPAVLVDGRGGGSVYPDMGIDYQKINGKQNIYEDIYYLLVITN